MPVLDPNSITPGQHESRVSHEPRRLGLVVVTGALLVAIGLGWFGGSNSYRRDELADSAAAARAESRDTAEVPGAHAK